MDDLLHAFALGASTPPSRQSSPFTWFRRDVSPGGADDASSRRLKASERAEVIKRAQVWKATDVSSKTSGPVQM
jgi:hypothetical protein